jgi:MiaB/RimO family radical SAM methylthiotransferase
VITNPRVSIVSLGCSRNDVDSEELAGRLSADGWTLVPDGSESDVVLINTCGFIEQAKKDSIDTILEAAEAMTGNGKVVAVGCLAQRYGKELALELPEADAILSFDDYADIGQTLRKVMAGETITPHEPGDRRTLLPITPVDRPAQRDEVATPGMGPHIYRSRLDDNPWAPLKIASGCDRRCTFCAIPAFRGSYVSRDPGEIFEEAIWLGHNGVREVLLVSENSTSYGKDLGDLRLLEKLLPVLVQADGIEWVRISYLQPAEMRPELIAAIANTPGVVPYFDLSFQHASNSVLRRMKRFGGTDNFLDLIGAIRIANPLAGIRTNVIVGFPGETEDDIQELADFIEGARLDAVGVFAYSDEDGTEAVKLPDHIPDHEVQARFDRISKLAVRISEDVASDRIGQDVLVLIEAAGNLGRAEHQGPEVDGVTTIISDSELAIGTIVKAVVTDCDGVDLIAHQVA